MSTQGDKTYKFKSSQLSKEQLMQAVRKKQECKAKAKLIIECLIQNYVEPADFLKMIENLNQSHYEDVVEERFILKHCGYPVCQNVLVDIPAKKYQISTATNKVYDITYRKMFCSTRCFKASEYIKTQMLTSPLWLREQEEIPKFELLSN